MPSYVFCDNERCMFNDGGECDVDKLSIVDGMCEGSVRYGRNVPFDTTDDVREDWHDNHQQGKGAT